MKEDLVSTLRTAVENCEISHLQLALKAGVPQSSISRFLAGGDIRLASAAKLAGCLGLHLVPKKESEKRKA